MGLFKFNDDSLLVSVDVGSYEIRCAVFRKSERFPLELISFVEKKSSGIEESRVINFEDACSVFNEVLETSEELCKSSFSEVCLGFSPTFYSFRSQGMAALISREVTKSDLNLALETARAVPLPDNHICLHSNPDFFCIDGQTRVSDPLGLSGLRLEIETYLVTVPRFYCQDIMKVLKNLGYTPRFFFHNLMVFGQNLTNPQQKKKGVCLCDIGHKSTRVIVYFDNKIDMMFSIPIGGEHFSLDLTSKFNIPLEDAELLKNNEGTLFFQPYEGKEETIDFGNGSLYLSKKIFTQTLEKTAEKLLNQIKSTLIHYKLLEKVSSGFLFTGNTAYIPGFNELASFYLEKPISHPNNFYESFKQMNNWALVQQMYLENNLTNQPQRFSSKRRFFWKELF